MSKFKWSEPRQGFHLPDQITKYTTEPNQESYWWHKRNSILGTVTIFTLVFLRIAPLQIIKYIFRHRQKKHTPSDQERRDFHTIYTELYFIILLLCLFILYKTNWFLPIIDNFFIYIPAWVLYWWLFLESVGWILYYSFYRILIERRFTIYSSSEYLVSIPFVICYQILLICLIFGEKYNSLMQNFFQFGGTDGNKTSHLVIAILRTIYVSFLLAYIVSLYPKMRVKLAMDFVSIGEGGAYDKYYKGSIQRIKGATVRACSPADEGIDEFFSWFKIYSSKHDQIYIISTPTPSHFSYISHLASIERNFFIEKPIVLNSREADILEANFQRFFQHAFFLQYYVLEKALPFTYLFHPFPEYEYFLRVGEENQKFKPGDRERILFAFTSLGRIKNISVKILEGEERSKHGENIHWTEASSSGGMLLDLGIHALSLLRVAGGTYGDLSDLFVEHHTHIKRIKSLRESDRRLLAPTLICASGILRVSATQNMNFTIEVGKHIAHNKRERALRAAFERGTLYCNFDEEKVILSLDDASLMDEEITTCTNPSDEAGRQKQPYYGMFVLGMRQLDGHWLYRTDLPRVQMAALRDVFLIEQTLANKHAIMHSRKSATYE